MHTKPEQKIFVRFEKDSAGIEYALYTDGSRENAVEYRRRKAEARAKLNLSPESKTA